MIPWYWLIVAAAVPSFFVGVLWIALKKTRADAEWRRASIRQSADTWSRLYGEATMKLQRIHNVLNETHPPIKKNDHA